MGKPFLWKNLTDGTQAFKIKDTLLEYIVIHGFARGSTMPCTTTKVYYNTSYDAI